MGSTWGLSVLNCKFSIVNALFERAAVAPSFSRLRKIAYVEKGISALHCSAIILWYVYQLPFHFSLLKIQCCRCFSIALLFAPGKCQSCWPLPALLRCVLDISRHKYKQRSRLK